MSNFSLFLIEKHSKIYEGCKMCNTQRESLDGFTVLGVGMVSMEILMGCAIVPPELRVSARPDLVASIQFHKTSMWTYN